MAKSFIIGARIDGSLRAAIRKAAAADQRSVASLITKILKEAMQKAGYLK